MAELGNASWDKQKLLLTCLVPSLKSKFCKQKMAAGKIFLQANADRREYRRMYQSSGSNILFEYACDENSAIGEICDELGIEGIRYKVVPQCD